MAQITVSGNTISEIRQALNDGPVFVGGPLRMSGQDYAGDQQRLAADAKFTQELQAKMQEVMGAQQMGPGGSPMEGTVAAQGVGDRARQMLDLVRLLQGFDLTKILELLAQLNEVASAKDISDKVLAAMKAAKTLAAMTANEADDAIVATIDSLLATPGLLQGIVDMVTRLLNGFTTSTKASAEFEGSCKAKGISIVAISELVALIMQLIKLLNPTPAVA